MATTKSSHRPPDKRIRNSQPTNLLRATAYYFHHKFAIGAIRNIVGVGRGGVGGERQFEAYKYRTRTIDVSETNLKCLSDFCQFFFYFDDKVATNKKSTSTEEYAIKYFFNTFITSLMTSFYKEAYELSVLNTKKSLCSGVPQSPR